MIQFTKSNFLNTILSEVSERDLRSNTSDSIKKFKDVAVSDIDKWFYNQLVTDDKFETSFNISSYQQNVFDKNVPGNGSASTDYGEFVRAFNKLVYRWFNDGDDPMYGPYSAINYFLKESHGSRKFGWDIEEFRLNGYSELVFGKEYYDLCSEYESKFDALIQRICKGIMIWEAGFSSKHADMVRNWCDSFTVLIDQLHDDIKGMDECQSSCDSYYKNCLEYKYPSIYNWVCEIFDNYRWNECSDDHFESFSSEIWFSVNSYHEITLSIEINNLTELFDKTNDFHIDVDADRNEEFSKLLRKFYTISKHQKEHTQCNEFITLDEYLKYFKSDRIKQMVLVKEDGKLILKSPQGN